MVRGRPELNTEMCNVYDYVCVYAQPSAVPVVSGVFDQQERPQMTATLSDQMQRGAPHQAKICLSVLAYLWFCEYA